MNTQVQSSVGMTEVAQQPRFTRPINKLRRLALGAISSVLLASAGTAGAQTTNLMPNGDFLNGGTDWAEINGGGGFVYSYPATGGNPDNCGIMDGTTAGASWCIWVGAGNTAIPLSTLGLTAGQTYTFLQDMKVLAGTNLGGIKIESWDSAMITDHGGDKRFATNGHNIANWETYGVNITLHPLATGIKIVPLWGPYSSVGFDNFRVAIPLSVPLSAQISSPNNQGRRGPNFTIAANASVTPGAVTNVAFYDGNTLLGDDTTAPYSWDVTGASLGNHGLTVVAKADTGASVTSAVVNVTVSTEVTVKVDPSKAWQGYLNWFETNGTYVNGSGWATADLRATVSGNTLTLAPNTIADPAPYWYVTTNSPSVGNKLLEANYFVGLPDYWPDQTVTFTGTVTGDSLLSLNNTNPAGQGWTAVAFIKDLAANYGSFDIASAPLVNGTFSVQFTTGPDTSRHLQYGFYVYGPCVWPTDPALAGYGNIQIQEISGPKITSTVSGGNLKLSFPTELHSTYTVQAKTNLTDAVWSSVAVTNGTGANAVITTPANGNRRFFRVAASSN